MEYICDKCGRVFDDPKELKNMGGDVGESVYVCPYCGHDEYEEVVECAVCGDVVRESETVECVCENCLNHHAGRKQAFALGKVCEDFIAVNGFIRSLLPDDEDIERILLETIIRRYWESDIEQLGKQFCRDDDYAYARFLKEKGMFI